MEQTAAQRRIFGVIRTNFLKRMRAHFYYVKRSPFFNGNLSVCPLSENSSMRFIFLACKNFLFFVMPPNDTAPSRHSPTTRRVGEGNTAIKREQSQTCLNYAEQEQGKADIVGLILHSIVHCAHLPRGCPSLLRIGA